MANDDGIGTDEAHLIGLHRLICGGGDRLVPELREAMMREAAWQRDHPNVVRFPLWAARNAGTGAGTRLVDDGAECGKLLAFAPPVGDKEDRRKHLSRRTE